MRDLTINDRLVFAANAYDFRLVRERVLAGADVNYVEPKKGTPLYAAVGDVQCVAYLLAHGADPNCYVDPVGDTALDKALRVLDQAGAAILIRQAGGIAKRGRILEAPHGRGALHFGTLVVWGAEHLQTTISRGEACFGGLAPGEHGEFRFDWAFPQNLKEPVGYLFQIVSMHLPGGSEVRALEVADYAFVAIDLAGRRHALSAPNHEVQIDTCVRVY